MRPIKTMSNLFNFIAWLLFRTFGKGLTIKEKAAEWCIFYSITDEFEERFLAHDQRHNEMKERRRFSNMREFINDPNEFRPLEKYNHRQIQYWKMILSGSIEKKIENNGVITEHSAALEDGAALVFSRNPHMEVSVMIFLPKTKDVLPVDAGYLIDTLYPGYNLTSLSALDRIAIFFRSLAEVYSSDGRPNIADAWRAFSARWFLPYIRDSTMRPPRIYGFFRTILQLTITIIFSATLIYIVERYLERSL